MKMSSIRHCAVAQVVFLAMAVTACQTAASADRKPVATDQRKEQLLANLKERHPQLEQLNPELADFEAVSPKFDSVKMKLMTPRGPQEQILLVTTTNDALYIVMDGPIDATKSKDEIAAAKEKQNKEKRAALDAGIKGLPAKGKADAKVTIIEFSDFQCPYCKRGFDTMEAVVGKYPDDVRLVFMHYPLPFHPWAKPASIAAVCAGNQKEEAFWLAHDGYFNNQKEITVENVIEKGESFVAAAGIDMAKWSDCAKTETSEAHKAAVKVVDAAMELGKNNGVTGTPAFFVNGEFVNGAVAVEEFDALIKKALGTGPEKAAAATAAQ
ncbi:MAG: hypothetical protein A2341_25180 [Deltaproteobacteria bacterium RIFOXYB12_FULL_58_9]|nr:MAG: hypothetical protein A2341_25180 [Deltaproteobacteria bacterium RIFOXYB12_FULL_58_9]